MRSASGATAPWSLAATSQRSVCPFDRPLLAFPGERGRLRWFLSRRAQRDCPAGRRFRGGKRLRRSSPCRSTCSPTGPRWSLLAELAYGNRRRAQWHIVNPAGDVAAIAGVIKICNAVLTHSYHAAIFALENRIPTLLFARTEYYRLKGEALRTAFGIPVPLIASPDMAHGAIADQLERSRSRPGARDDECGRRCLARSLPAARRESSGEDVDREFRLHRIRTRWLIVWRREEPNDSSKRRTPPQETPPMTTARAHLVDVSVTRWIAALPLGLVRSGSLSSRQLTKVESRCGAVV